jgi:hypothetical protein
VLLVAFGAGCSNGAGTGDWWTVQQAEAMTTVRGMKVRVLECRGLGRRQLDGGVERFRRFACEAGARRPGETYDTVGVLYTIRVVDSRTHVLESARFHGGPGIP